MVASCIIGLSVCLWNKSAVPTKEPDVSHPCPPAPLSKCLTLQELSETITAFRVHSKCNLSAPGYCDFVFGILERGGGGGGGGGAGGAGCVSQL